jgi:hypothetical protein
VSRLLIGNPHNREGKTTVAGVVLAGACSGDSASTLDASADVNVPETGEMHEMFSP